MSHNDVQHKLLLALYNELDSEDLGLVEAHLTECETCRQEYAQLSRLHRLVSLAKPPPPQARLVMEARQNLRAVLRYERSRSSFWQRFKVRLTGLLNALTPSAHPVPAMALGGLVLFAAGAASSSYLLNSSTDLIGLRDSRVAALDAISQGDVDIANVEFLNSDPSTGSVEFMFDAIRPVRIKGTVDDQRIQKILAYAVVNDQNPGVRLRAVNTVGTLGQPGGEGEIKRALITALKSDSNVGVRREAYTALMKYPFDESIKQALIHVLTLDDNPGLRIEAIATLEARVRSKVGADPDLVNAFRSRMETDDNTFIRARARTVVESLTNP